MERKGGAAGAEWGSPVQPQFDVAGGENPAPGRVAVGTLNEVINAAIREERRSGSPGYRQPANKTKRETKRNKKRCRRTNGRRRDQSRERRLIRRAPEYRSLRRQERSRSSSDYARHPRVYCVSVCMHTVEQSVRLGNVVYVGRWFPSKTNKNKLHVPVPSPTCRRGWCLKKVSSVETHGEKPA